jgi:peptidoglycan/xylan/chitin deacetylase (PgdA/CDA1 family)
MKEYEVGEHPLPVIRRRRSRLGTQGTPPSREPMNSRPLTRFASCIALAALVLGTPPTQVAAQTSRAVAITIDDLPTVAAGPGADANEIVTEALLRTLVEHGITATGFVNEIKLDSAGMPSGRGRRLLEAWIEAGQDLGNHTYSHLWFYESDPAAFIADIERGERVWRPLMEARGPFVPYLRHPRLNTGPTAEARAVVEGYLDSVGYEVAPVTIDNYDYLFANAYARTLGRGDAEQAERIADEYVAYMDTVFGFYESQSMAILGYEPKQVLLLHANRLNADHLHRVLARLRDRGYDFVTLGEALEDEAYDRPDAFVGRMGITWLHRWAITAGMPGSTFRGEPPVPDWIVELAESE